MTDTEYQDSPEIMIVKLTSGDEYVAVVTIHEVQYENDMVSLTYQLFLPLLLTKVYVNEEYQVAYLYEKFLDGSGQDAVDVDSSDVMMVWPVNDYHYKNYMKYSGVGEEMEGATQFLLHDDESNKPEPPNLTIVPFKKPDSED